MIPTVVRTHSPRRDDRYRLLDQKTQPNPGLLLEAGDSQLEGNADVCFSRSSASERPRLRPPSTGGTRIEPVDI